MGDEVQGMAHEEVTAPVAAEGAKVERNRLWRAKNRAALQAYADEVAREGLALAAFRSF